MASVAKIIEDTRIDTATTDQDVNDSKAITFFNRRYHEIENTIVNMLNENYFYQEYVQDIVADQDLYDLPEGSSTIVGELKKILQVGYKLVSTQTTYTYVAPTSFGSMINRTPSEFDNQVTNERPYFLIVGGKIQLFPKPTEDVTDGLIIRGIENQVDLDITGTEEDITIPWQFQYVISLGMQQDFYRVWQKHDMAEQARQRYEQEKINMIRQLTNRDATSFEGDVPPLIPLMY